MTDWKFEHSIFTKANKKTAWGFLTDMSNQVRMEPGIENIELDGEFTTGTIGRTITKNYTQEWELSKVIIEKLFVITGKTESKDLVLSFSWEFEDEGNGTRLTQNIKATGSKLEKYQETFRNMEENAPIQMTKLAVELDNLA